MVPARRYGTESELVLTEATWVHDRPAEHVGVSLRLVAVLFLAA
jgi:hypothetical protein